MAFTLSKVRAYGIESEEVVAKRYKQSLILNIAAANTDVDLDLSDYSGTFWTAVGATEPGITALKAIKDIQVAADSFVGLGASSLVGKVEEPADGTVSAAGYYQVVLDSTNNKLPNLLFLATNAPTSYVLELSWVLKDAQMPILVAKEA